MTDRTNQQSRDMGRYADGRRSSALGELWHFMRHNKKWWLTPILLVLGFLGLLIVLGGTAAAPFIYTVF